MTEVCLLLIKGNMGGTRPTAPKARRSRQQSGLGYEVGEGEGIKSLSYFRLFLPLDPISASPICRAESTILPRDRGSARSTTALGWLALTCLSFIKMYLPACMRTSDPHSLTLGDNQC